MEIEQIRSAIETRGAHWRAAETEIFRRGLQSPGAGLLGMRVTPEIIQLAETSDLGVPGKPIAPEVDWRTDARGVVTPVKDQTENCGACVAFATNAALESDAIIRHGQRQILSEAHLFHCNGGSCDDGWEMTAGLIAAKNTGVGLESDFPWKWDSPCISTKPVLRLRSMRILKTIDNRKRAVMKGPVFAGMRVYEDFTAYDGGIYENVIGDDVGDHAVCVVGYSDIDSCWIVKNSWGAEFGEGGFFRIAYGQCGIDDDFPFIAVQTEPLAP